MEHRHSAVALSLNIPLDVHHQLDALADSMGKSPSSLAEEAIQGYIAAQRWQVQAIENAVAKANHPDAHLIDHHQVTAWVNSWGSGDELDMPQ